MKINEVIWDDAVYPRAAVSQSTVAAYVEALSIGAQFPAVMVQRVVNYTPGRDVSATVVILIDGVHRWHAFKQAGRTDIPVVHYQEAVLDYEAAKTDLLLFKALDWGLRTWDQWQFNDCDDRFGSDWPGRIPAQLVAHTLYYFTRPGDRVLDPMAGGGVVPDVCP